MTIREAATFVRRSVRTLQRWDREGVLRPEGRTATNRRFYSKRQLEAFLGLQVQAPEAERRVIAYCRVSSQAQRPDLKNQRHLLETFCAAKGLVDVEWIEEVGGGLNFKRPKFAAMMEAVERGEVKTIVLAHKDRLCRFGFDWFHALCERKRCEFLILNAESLSPEQEMVEDLMTIIHCFSSRLYGLRNYRKTLQKALAQTESTHPSSES